MRTVESRARTTRELSPGATVLRAVGLTVMYALVPVVVMVAMMPWVLDGAVEMRDLLIVKALVVSVGLAAITYFSDRRRPLGWLVGIAGLGYLICPMAWSGRAYMGQLWYQPGVATVLFDLVAWLAVVLATAVVARQVRG